MKPFLYQVASLFYSEYGAEVSRLAFVFPNRRTGLFFQKYLSEVSEKPLFSPTILTINDLFVQLSGKQAADRISMLFKLYDIYLRHSGSSETFDEFLYWGEMLLNDDIRYEVLPSTFKSLPIKKPTIITAVTEMIVNNIPSLPEASEV